MVAERDEPLLEALRENRWEEVREAGSRAVDIKAGDKSSLALAASLGHTETVKALLDLGARDPPARAPLWSAAMHAAFAGHIDILQHLLRSDRHSVLASDPFSLSCLQIAALKGRTECVQHLLDAAEDAIDVVDTHGRTLLMLAATSGEPSTIELLVRRGAELRKTSNDGKTALHWAVFSHQPQAVEVLVKLGADIDAEDFPLDEPVLKPGIQTNKGRSPLDLSLVRQGKDPVLKHIAEYLKASRTAQLGGRSPPSMAPMPWIQHAKKIAAGQAEEQQTEQATGGALCAPVTDTYDIFGSDIEDASKESTTSTEAVEASSAHGETGELDELD